MSFDIKIPYCSMRPLRRVLFYIIKTHNVFLFVLFVEEVGVDLCDNIMFDVVELHMYYTLSRWAASSHLSESTQLFARSTETTY